VTTLVCGLADDAPITLLLESLRRKHADFLFLDQRQFGDSVQLRWQLTDAGISGHLRVGANTLDIHDIHSVYHRFVSPEVLQGPSDSPRTLGVSRSVLCSLVSLLDVLPARVVNRRRPMMSNNSKPYQALLIRKAGLAVPKTLITNEPGALRQFMAAEGSLIYKSISSVRSIVAPLDGERASRIAYVRSLPTQFQRKVEGINVRVHVIGRRMFATRVLTTATDYRYASLEGAEARFVPYELTTELRRSCLRLARVCELPFAGIDLMVAEDGVHFLEVNPAPGYSYFQEKTGQPISDALAEYLVCGAPGADPVSPAAGSGPALRQDLAS
jgi:hypothetical protein